MADLGVAIPKTHDLGLLHTLLLPHQSSLRPLRRGMRFLTLFAVDTRYPGENATKRDAVAALRWADRVRTEARSLLGIRTRRR
jgi:HEPN domain-containing protein